MSSFPSTSFGLGIGGPGVMTDPPIEFFDHFVSGGTSNTASVGAKFSVTADVAPWLRSVDNNGTAAIIDAGPGGVVRLTPGTSANDYCSVQLNGEAFQTGSTRRIFFQTRVRTNDSDDIKFVIGLATTHGGTSATAGPVLDGATGGVYFRNSAGNTTAFSSLTESASTETATASVGTLADDTFIELAIEVIGRDRVNFYVNKVKVASHTANIPLTTEYLTPTFEVGSPTGTTATYLDVDYVYVVQNNNV